MSGYGNIGADHGRIVSAEKAKSHLPQTPDEWIDLSRRNRVLADLSHTVVVQAKQIAAVFAIHEPLAWTDADGNETEVCATCVRWHDSRTAESLEFPCPTARTFGVEQ